MTQIIPTSPVASQTMAVSLNGQRCRINLYQRITGLYCSLLVNDVLVIGGVICQANNPIVRDLYFGFAGDLVILDYEGEQDPDYTGLGTRWQLVYYEQFQIVAPQRS